MSATTCILIVLLLRFVQGYFGKQQSIYYPQTVRGRIWVLAVSDLLSTAAAVVVWAMDGFEATLSVATVICAALSGLALVAATLFGVLAMQSGTMALSSVAGTAGMLVPCIVGIWLFNEPVHPIVWLLIAILLGSIYWLGRVSREVCPRISGGTVLLLIGSFFANGVTMVCQKYVAVYRPEDSVALFSMLTFAVPAVILGVGAFLPVYRERGEKPNQYLWISIFILAIAVTLINQFATVAGKTANSAVLFAIIGGGATVITTLIGAMFYKEKITPRIAIGILLCIGALIGIKCF